MPKFFCEEIQDGRATLTGEDAAHLIKVLRVRPGEELTLCDLQGTDYTGRVSSVAQGAVVVEILSSMPCAAEPKSKITLFMALPKGDKMELIVQKAVELGVHEIVPVLVKRCVSRPEAGALEKKTARWQKISAEAAKQSGRGIIPAVLPTCSFAEALNQMDAFERRILFYEQATVPLGGLLKAPAKTAIFVGPEGGFEPEEVQLAATAGVHICTLGPRILRCETAPLAAISVLLAAEEIL